MLLALWVLPAAQLGLLQGLQWNWGRRLQQQQQRQPRTKAGMVVSSSLLGERSREGPPLSRPALPRKTGGACRFIFQAWPSLPAFPSPLPACLPPEGSVLLP